MSSDDDLKFDAQMLEAGNAVARLSRPKVPQGLAARTLARIAAASAPVRQRLWLFRPITNPSARCAAAAAILMALVPLSDIELAGHIGSRIEDRVVGRQVMDRVETIMDGVLPRGLPNGYSQADLDAVSNSHSTNRRALKIQVRSVKPPANLGV